MQQETRNFLFLKKICIFFSSMKLNFYNVAIEIFLFRNICFPGFPFRVLNFKHRVENTTIVKHKLLNVIAY